MDDSLETKNSIPLAERLHRLETALKGIDSHKAEEIRFRFESAIFRAEYDLNELEKQSSSSQATKHEKLPDAPDFKAELEEVLKTKELGAPAEFAELPAPEILDNSIDVMGEKIFDIRRDFEPDAEILTSYNPNANFAVVYDQAVVEKYKHALQESKLAEKHNPMVNSSRRIANYRKPFTFNDREKKEVMLEVNVITSRDKITMEVIIPSGYRGGRDTGYQKEISFYKKGDKHPWKNLVFEKDCMSIGPWVNPVENQRVERLFPNGGDIPSMLAEYNLPWLEARLHELAQEDARKVTIFGREFFAQTVRQGFQSNLNGFSPNLTRVKAYEPGMRNVVVCSNSLYNQSKNCLGSLSKRLQPPLPQYSSWEKPKERNLEIETKTPDGKGVLRIVPTERLNPDKQTYSLSIRLEVDITGDGKTTTYVNSVSLHSKEEDRNVAEKALKFAPKKPDSSYGHVRIELVGGPQQTSPKPESSLFENAVVLTGWRDLNAPMDSTVISGIGVCKIPPAHQEILKQIDFDFILGEIAKSAGK